MNKLFGVCLSALDGLLKEAQSLGYEHFKSDNLSLAQEALAPQSPRELHALEILQFHQRDSRVPTLLLGFVRFPRESSSHPRGSELIVTLEAHSHPTYNPLQSVELARYLRIVPIPSICDQISLSCAKLEDVVNSGFCLRTAQIWYRRVAHPKIEVEPQQCGSSLRKSRNVMVV